MGTNRIVMGGAIGAVAMGIVVGCASGRPAFDDEENGGNTGGASGGSPPGFGGEGGASSTDPAIDPSRDPVDCAEAKTTKSYVGCDYWPTVTANSVWSVFDFAVVVSNLGTKDADVTVTGPASFSTKVKVPAGAVQKIFLPWVESLKGPECDECGQPKAGRKRFRQGPFKRVVPEPRRDAAEGLLDRGGRPQDKLAAGIDRKKRFFFARLPVELFGGHEFDEIRRPPVKF
jgi:hypothetical protein